ncbi:prolyl 3-hydroxylase 1-like isoform X2 [Physella acuta]|uniref:prolyl 3-hydroxylase 1-like isoform X2 n=1 Tax=Physella acuta TaxID=109671 RepID=UPI0027DBC57D|nr:prolyl 3-hydroxylase 1-like isoform X2 [Physella acuta]
MPRNQLTHIFILMKLIIFVLFVHWADGDAYSANTGYGQTDDVIVVPTDHNQESEQIDQGITANKNEVFKLLTEINATFDQLYQDGVKAYNDHLWYSCASKMERAIKDYNNFKRVLSDCRLDCSKGIRSSKLTNITSKFVDFSVYASFLKASDCFRRCTDESLTTHPKVTEKLESLFEKRKPYMYLQFCLYKLDRFTQAASAAYTFLLANPDDEDTKHNIIYYRDQVKVAEQDFIDLEMKPYKENYIRALMAYKAEQWQATIDLIESALEEYWKENERCQVECEAQSKWQGTEFKTEVADWIINILNCQLRCEEKLSIVFSDPIPFFLRDMYHYLQFGYYKVKNLEKSVAATATFLLFNSTHKVMLENKKMLKEKLGYTDKDFVPREDAAEYLARRKEMQEIMDNINKNYMWPDKSMVKEEPEATPKAEQVSDASDNWLAWYEQIGVHLVATLTDLNRQERVVVDGIIKAEQCEQLLSFVKDMKEQTSGPQTFDFKRAQKLLKDDPNEELESTLRLMIRSSESIQEYLHRYLGSYNPFYFNNISIVCWQKPKDPGLVKNCYPQEDGSCIQFDSMPDKLSSDSYTTITYLNAVEDGDFQFLNEKQRVDNSFGVKCGRTIGFNSNDRHTLKIPDSDVQRCALITRFKPQPPHGADVKGTVNLLRNIDELRYIKTNISAKEVLTKFYEQGVKVAMNGTDLKGKERVVVDEMATEEQCSTLRNVALSISLLGDGYLHLASKPSFISPHTEHELYQGITVYRAAKLTNDGIISSYGLRTFLELSEKSRLFVEKYFNLTKPLFFDYTHLVCRTAIKDPSFPREDLSHPVHADNCNLNEDGSCTKGFPAFTQRDYSALLYLNADFEGGEFFFAHANKSEQVSLKSKCGRLVAFNAGEFHGVKAVKSGQRCALALWFTLNSRYKELAHTQAHRILRVVEDSQKSDIKHQEL